MSDKYLQQATELDKNLRKEKMMGQKYDTKIKNAERIKDSDLNEERKPKGSIQ